MYTVSNLLAQYSEPILEMVCDRGEQGKLDKPLQRESDGREPDMNTGWVIS